VVGDHQDRQSKLQRGRWCARDGLGHTGQYLRGPYVSEIIDAEREARGKKLGLWQQANPQSRWEFRMIKRGGKK